MGNNSNNSDEKCLHIPEDVVELTVDTKKERRLLVRFSDKRGKEHTRIMLVNHKGHLSMV